MLCRGTSFKIKSTVLQNIQLPYAKVIGMIAFANNLSKKIFQSQISFDEYLRRAEEKCEELRHVSSKIDVDDYVYSAEVTKEALGLDDELIDSLLEEYVAQIITTLPRFREMLKQIRKRMKKGEKAEFTQLRELAHKNLGVARNLHIKDAQKILYNIMTSDDIDEVERCLEYLEACTILLKPETAYDAYVS